MEQEVEIPTQNGVVKVNEDEVIFTRHNNSRHSVSLPDIDTVEMVRNEGEASEGAVAGFVAISALASILSMIYNMNILTIFPVLVTIVGLIYFISLTYNSTYKIQLIGDGIQRTIHMNKENVPDLLNQFDEDMIMKERRK